MEAKRDTPDLRQAEDASTQRRPAMLAHLRIGEAIVAVAPMKSWISWRLSHTNAAEERRKGAVYSLHDILQHLGVDFGILRHRLFDTGQLGLLLVAGDRDTAGAPGFPALA